MRLFWSDRPGRWHKSRRRAVPRHAAGPAGPTDPTGPASPAAAAASSDMDVTSMSSWRHGCDIHVVTGPPARPGRTPPAPPAPAPGHSLRKSHTHSTLTGPDRTLRHLPGCAAKPRLRAGVRPAAGARRLLPVMYLMAAWYVSGRPLTTSMPQRCRGGDIVVTTMSLPRADVQGCVWLGWIVWWLSLW